MAFIPNIASELGLESGVERNNNLLTRCPWPANHKHGDTNSSFAIHVDTGAWICYAGCGAGGLEMLVERLKRVTREEARKWIRARRGGDVSFAQVVGVLRPVEVADDVDEAPILDAQEDYDSMAADTTSQYFLDRGFTMETIREWGIRYDRARKALVIPVRDIHGKLVGVVRRFVPPVSAGRPKYLYTEGFDRRLHLFAADRHPKNDTTIVVEGPLDALWLHQCGYPTTVALMGSFCSKEQAQILKRLSGTALLALDNDDAGKRATDRLITQLHGEMSIQRLKPYAGKDLQELSPSQLGEVLNEREYPWSGAV